MGAASQTTGIARRRAIQTILAVDHDRAHLTLLAKGLGDLGYLVVLAGTGSQALELISARGIDLVLVEAGLPDLPGLQILQEIRGCRDTADLPVMMMAAQGDPRGHADAMIAGADDYLLRPFAFDVLAARIGRALARAERMEELKRSNLALDARVAERAIELGEVRTELGALRADRARTRPTFERSRPA